MDKTPEVLLPEKRPRIIKRLFLFYQSAKSLFFRVNLVVRFFKVAGKLFFLSFFSQFNFKGEYFVFLADRVLMNSFFGTGEQKRFKTLLNKTPQQQGDPRLSFWKSA